MIIGGNGEKSVGYLHLSGKRIVEDCWGFTDAPFDTTDAITLRDGNEQPMICGGKKNPRQNSCVIFSMGRNKWTEGPTLEQERAGATTTCLGNGVCWVFGGMSRLGTWFLP